MQQSESKKDMERLKDRLSPSFLGEDKNFFKEKLCLDVGCGSNFNGTLSMLKHGAKHVTALDLDESILELSSKLLSKYHKSRYDLVFSNVLNLNLKNDVFDFTYCVGVLHHTRDVLLGLKELVRVTKPGGRIFIETYGFGGVIRELSDLLRNKYQNDNKFRDIIDNLSEQEFSNFFYFLKHTMKKQNDKNFTSLNLNFMKKMFDKSLVLTIKDIICSPVYHQNSEKELRQYLKKFGCHEIKRLKYYPRFYNIRKFLSPLYYQYENKYSELLYGDGVIKLIASKK